MIKILTDELTDVIITPSTGFTILYNNSVRVGNLLFLTFGIKKNSGYYIFEDEVCATIESITPFSQVVTCGLASKGDWSIENMGYCFTSKNIVISDRNDLKKYNRAHVNTMVKIKNRLT